MKILFTFLATLTSTGESTESLSNYCICATFSVLPCFTTQIEYKNAVLARICVTLLQGTSEAHEDKHVYREQVGQKEVARAGAARQQPGEIEAPPSEPPPARHHATFHLGVQTAHSQGDSPSNHIMTHYCFTGISETTNQGVVRQAVVT